MCKSNSDSVNIESVEKLKVWQTLKPFLWRVKNKMNERLIVLWVATGYWEPRSLYLHTQVIVCVPLRIWQHCLVWYTRCLVYPQITSVAGFHFNLSWATPDFHCIICLSLPSVIIRCGSCWSGIQDWNHTGCMQIRMITHDFKNKLWDHIHSETIHSAIHRNLIWFMFIISLFTSSY